MKIKKTKSTSTYRNTLGSLRIYYRDFLKQPDIIKDYELPSRGWKPKILPSKTALKQFYDALPQQYRPHFLLLASSGVRVSELFTAEIDIDNRMIIPKSHNGKTKFSYLSFYNDEAAELMNQYIPKNKDTLGHIFLKTSKKCGIKCNPHTLRAIFTMEMLKSGCPEIYINAFCGRVPISIISRNYTDYNPEVMREIYLRANIKIL